MSTPPSSKPLDPTPLQESTGLANSSLHTTRTPADVNAATSDGTAAPESGTTTSASRVQLSESYLEFCAKHGFTSKRDPKKYSIKNQIYIPRSGNTCRPLMRSTEKRAVGALGAGARNKMQSTIQPTQQTENNSKSTNTKDDQPSLTSVDPPTLQEKTETTSPPTQDAQIPTDTDITNTTSNNSCTATSRVVLSDTYLQFMAMHNFSNQRGTQNNKKKPAWKCMSCICPDSGRCKQLVNAWSELGERYAHMLEYVYSPIRSSKKSPLGQHVNGLRDGISRHLLGNDSSLVAKFNKNNAPIAAHHFISCLRDAMQRSKDEKRQLNRYRCTEQEAEEAGFTDEDLCQVNDSEGNASYYILPTVTDYSTIEFDLNKAKLQHYYDQKIDAAVIAKPNDPILLGIATNPECYENHITRYKEQLASSKALQEEAKVEYEANIKKVQDEKNAEKVNYELKIKQLQEKLEHATKKPMRTRKRKTDEKATQEILTASMALSNLSSSAAISEELSEKPEKKKRRSKRTK